MGNARYRNGNIQWSIEEMTASKVIKRLDKLIKRYGDNEVYFEYDEGIRIQSQHITYKKKITANRYSEHWGQLERVFIINYSDDNI